MPIIDSQIKDLVQANSLLSAEKLDLVCAEAKKRHMTLLDYLPESGLLTPEQLGTAVAGFFHFPYANLRKVDIDDKVLQLIPEIMARAKGVVVFACDKERLKLGMLDPHDIEAIHLVSKKTARQVDPYFITKHDLDHALAGYRGSLQEEFFALLAKMRQSSVMLEEKDKLTVRMVDILMQFGYESGASDIHIEPHKTDTVVRFRIDGIMHDMLRIPKEFHELLLSRVKILSKMRTDEHRTAQDGKFRFDIFTQDEKVDVRVSVIPIAHGENIVMRILSGQNKDYTFADLGLTGKNLEKIERAILDPHGMILVTGPTGSGKTTTIYGLLKILNKREVNIASIEDPIEYEIDGVNQIQVNDKTTLTFAHGLRAILRQDPDIIMIGEIRDGETASIAINSALTGHLVLSTLHTNDAATTLPRLLDMGIEPFLVASTVNVAIGQRLVRKICPWCRVSAKATAAELSLIKNDKRLVEALANEGYSDLKRLRFYKGTGCDVCGRTGFVGRIGIFEVMELSENIRSLVSRNITSDELFAAAKKEGMTTMLNDGVGKALLGITTLAEVVRVTND